MTAADSYRSQNLKLEYLPEDSLQQQNYVPLPAGRIFKYKNCLQADSIFQILDFKKLNFLVDRPLNHKTSLQTESL